MGNPDVITHLEHIEIFSLTVYHLAAFHTFFNRHFLAFSKEIVKHLFNYLDQEEIICLSVFSNLNILLIFDSY